MIKFSDYIMFWSKAMVLNSNKVVVWQINSVHCFILSDLNLHKHLCCKQSTTNFSTLKSLVYSLPQTKHGTQLHDAIGNSQSEVIAWVLRSVSLPYWSIIFKITKFKTYSPTADEYMFMNLLTRAHSFNFWAEIPFWKSVNQCASLQFCILGCWKLLNWVTLYHRIQKELSCMFYEKSYLSYAYNNLMELSFPPVFSSSIFKSHLVNTGCVTLYFTAIKDDIFS